MCSEPLYERIFTIGARNGGEVGSLTRGVRLARAIEHGVLRFRESGGAKGACCSISLGERCGQ